jgi:hypothetical protein
MTLTILLLCISGSTHESRSLVVYASVSDPISTKNELNSTLPQAKMIYANRSYDMLPFVVLNDEGVNKLNFPHLADDYKPVVQMPSDRNFTFQFTKQPREINAFGIDYDADTTEVYPLIKTGKDQFTFGKVHGTLTLEVRAIFNDGIYTTYTCLVDIKNTSADDGNQSTATDIFG